MKSLAARMAAVMGGISRLKKTGWNNHQSYEFATDGDVSDLVRGSLSENGIAFCIEAVDIVSREPHGKQYRIVIKWRMMLTNADDKNDYLELDWFSEALDSQDKAFSKAATSAVKYFLLKTFLVSTGDPRDDPDTGTPNAEGDVAFATKAQLDKMRELVSTLGQDWGGFQDHIIKRYGVNPTQLQTAQAGDVIASMQAKIDTKQSDTDRVKNQIKGKK